MHRTRLCPQCGGQCFQEEVQGLCPRCLRRMLLRLDATAPDPQLRKPKETPALAVRSKLENLTMKTSPIILAAMMIAAPALHAQLVADGATNTLINVTNTFTGDVIVG